MLTLFIVVFSPMIAKVAPCPLNFRDRLFPLILSIEVWTALLDASIVRFAPFVLLIVIVPKFAIVFFTLSV